MADIMEDTTEDITADIMEDMAAPDLAAVIIITTWAAVIIITTWVAECGTGRPATEAAAAACSL